jgi:hypothetical protein
MINFVTISGQALSLGDGDNLAVPVGAMAAETDERLRLLLRPLAPA